MTIQRKWRLRFIKFKFDYFSMSYRCVRKENLGSIKRKVILPIIALFGFSISVVYEWYEITEEK